MAAAILLCLSGCDEYYWYGQPYLSIYITSGTDHAGPCEPASFALTSTAYGCNPSFRYLVHWGDSTTSISSVQSVGDTCVMNHDWDYPGNYEVWATAQVDSHSTSITVHPSAYRMVSVVSASAPVIDSAQLAAQRHPVELRVSAHSPVGDSLRLAVAWGDGKAETTAFQSSPSQFSVMHAYAIDSEVKVVFRALSWSWAGSAEETLTAVVSSTGGVAWCRKGHFTGSPVIVGDVVYVVGQDGLYGLRDASTVYFCPGAFIGQPSVSSSALHGYVGSQAGRLCAFTQELTPVWQYPAQESAPLGYWGPAAINGNLLYVPCWNDSVYCLIDSGTSVTRKAAFAAAQVDACVLDAAGSVYFGADSGYLYKLTPDLNLVWRTQLQPSGRVFAPVLGADGTIYCAAAFGHMFAVDAAGGAVKWSAQLSYQPFRPLVGADGLYVVDSNNLLSKLSLNSGAFVWTKNIPFAGYTPVLASGGYLYIRTNVDRLYCLTQLDGDSVWVCNCADYLPPGRAGTSDDISSPTVDAEGNVYFVGPDAIYKVTANSPLDATAPWPKWQHDLYNSGNAGGGR